MCKYRKKRRFFPRTTSFAANASRQIPRGIIPKTTLHRAGSKHLSFNLHPRSNKPYPSLGNPVHKTRQNERERIKRRARARRPDKRSRLLRARIRYSPGVRAHAQACAQQRASRKISRSGAEAIVRRSSSITNSRMVICKGTVHRPPAPRSNVYVRRGHQHQSAVTRARGSSLAAAAAADRMARKFSRFSARAVWRWKKIPARVYQWVTNFHSDAGA